jgi:hypothetical protein
MSTSILDLLKRADNSQNVDSRLRAVQVKAPKASAFKLISVPRGLRLAPGMSSSFTIQYTPCETQKSDIVDEILISSEAIAVPVKVCCSAPRPHIVLHGDLNFTMIPSGASVHKEAILRNEGSMVGSWTAAIDGDLVVHLSATSGTLEPGAEEIMTVLLRDVDAGQAMSDVIITTAGFSPPLRAPVRLTSINVSHDVLDGSGGLATEVCCITSGH